MIDATFPLALYYTLDFLYNKYQFKTYNAWICRRKPHGRIINLQLSFLQDF